MRCYCCNKALNDYESTLRSATTGEFLDMCTSCLNELDIDTVGREDLHGFDNQNEEIEIEEVEEE